MLTNCSPILIAVAIGAVIYLLVSLVSGRCFGSRRRISRANEPGDYWTSIAILALIAFVLLSMAYQVRAVGDFISKWLVPAFKYGFFWLIFPFMAFLSVIKGEFKTGFHFDEDWETIRLSESPKKFWSAVWSSVFMGFLMFFGCLYFALK